MPLAITFVQWLQALLHWDSGVGLNWWSGLGSDLGELGIVVSVLGVALGYYKHHQCEYSTCKKMGHPHPDHQRPVCRTHYHHDVAPPKPQS